MFTEGEAYALVQDNVTREVAAATAEKDNRISELERENASLKDANDTLAVEKAAEADRANAAAQELEDFKAQTEADRETAARRETRLAALKEAAPALELTDERTERIVAMSDEHFDEYITGLREAASASGAPSEKPDEKPVPRESAAFKGGDGGSGGAQQGVILPFLGARRALGS
jgi:chromosome segregation ATPase